MLLEGVQLGRYRLLHLLGSGGMGEVYVGEDTHIRRQVAIKVIRAEAVSYRVEGSLSTWLQQRGGSRLVSPLEVTHYIRQAAAALTYAHNHKIIHQDVKPSNFLVRNNLEDPNHPDLLLADVGIAKFTSASASMSQTSRGTPT